jgi:hypothetical protein
LADSAFKEIDAAADKCDGRHARGRENRRREDGPVAVMMSWARSAVATVEHKLGRGEDYFDRILIAVVALLAVAIAILFTQ